MQIFDRIDPLKLEQRDAQLWVFAIAVIVILTAGLALLLYPAAFSKAVAISGPAMRKIFFSFCALSVLVVGYLVDRQIAIRNLRRRLALEEGRNARLLQQASIELLASLPNFEHFQDRLAMEFRRAAIAHQPFSVVAVSLNPRNLADGDELATAFGDAAKSMIRRIRRQDSLYLFRPGVFGIILPDEREADGTSITERLAQGLEESTGPSHRFFSDLKIINYPEDASTARDMENLAVRAFPGKAVGAQAA
jgi:GGDEF domain-containing protein